MTLLVAVERGLRFHNLSASRCGREVARDPRLVFDLRRGRQPRAETESRVRAFIAAQSAQVTQ